MSRRRRKTKGTIDEIKITEKMQAKIDGYHEYFYSRTVGGHIVDYPNGFVGVGVLAEPQDHVSAAVNTVWIYQVAFSRDAKKIVEIQNVETTLDEAEDLRRCLNTVIREAKTGRKKTQN